MTTALGLALGTAWAVAAAAVASTRLRRSAQRWPAGRALPGAGVTALPRGAVRASSGAGAPVAPDAAVTAASGAVTPILTSAAPGRRSPVTALGAAVRRLAGAVVDGTDPGPSRAAAPGATAQGGAVDQTGDRRTGWAALASGGLLVLAPALAAVPVVWAIVTPALAARRDRTRREALLHDQLPDVVDLLALTTAAGLPVGAALVAIGDRPGGPLGASLAQAAAHVRRGGSTSDALAVVRTAGPPVRPIVDALLQHDRYGTPLLPALERVGIEARARRRRRAEESARRLPVTLLFPLVLTTLPAFVLLTVVPLLAGSLGSLSLTST